MKVHHSLSVRAALCIMLCFAALLACASQRHVQPEDEQPQLAEPKDGETVTLVGHLSDAGVATGKSMAAWHGFSVGERVYELTLDPNQLRSQTSVRVHLTQVSLLADDLGKRVRITGKWRVSPPIHKQEIELRQVPVRNDGPHSDISQPNPTLQAVRIEIR